MRTRFICSLDNEAVLKALFKLKDDEFTGYQVTQEIEAARVAKETVYGTTPKPVYTVGQPKSKANPPRAPIPKAKDTPQGKLMLDQPLSKVACGRCWKKIHTGKIAQTSMMSAITVKRRDVCNPFAGPKYSRAQESGTCKSWIQYRQ